MLYATCFNIILNQGNNIINCFCIKNICEQFNFSFINQTASLNSLHIVKQH